MYFINFFSLHSSINNLRDIQLRQKYEQILEQGTQNSQNLSRNLYELRKLILLEGLPKDEVYI